MGGLENSEQQYSLRWNDFHSSILSSFRHLRDEEDFVDVTLACDGCSFTAHKVVLSACSPYFRSLLKANPCQHPIVILRDVREQDMESLLRFMYNGEVHIGQEQLTDFLKTAQTLQVRGLADVPTKDHQKLLPNTNSLPWPTSSDTQLTNDNPLSPPPPKRSRSVEQHTPLPLPLSLPLPLTPSINRFSPSPSLHHNNNNSGTGNNNNNSISNNSVMSNHTPSCEPGSRESLLSQALETSQSHHHTNNNNQLKGSDSSAHAQSTGEESNSSDTGLSDRGGVGGGGGGLPQLPHGLDLVHPKSEPQDYSDHSQTPHHNNSLVLDPSRTPNFPAALLGLQGLLPGPSGMHNNGQDNNFGSAGWLWETSGTEPPSNKPICPECGKIYSNNSNLKQHIANVHSSTLAWELCQVCGKRFKTKQYLQVHLLATHGIRQRKSYNPFFPGEVSQN